MTKAELKSFGKPDEVREFPKGRLELLESASGQSSPIAQSLARKLADFSGLYPRAIVEKGRKMTLKLLTWTTCGVLICAGLASAKSPATDKPVPITLTPADVKYGPAPPVFPAGAQLAVLYGDPSKPSPFALRFKMPDGYRIPPHWHSRAEQLTVLSGTFALGMGDKADGASASLDAGSFHFLPARQHHFAAAHGETVVEVHGQGPFDIHYLNPADDPTHLSKPTK